LDRLENILIKVANFSIAVKIGSLSDPALIISDALMLDSELISWANTLPSTWAYSTITVSSLLGKQLDDLAYGGECHVYGGHWIGSAWNNYRSTRIAVHMNILIAIQQSQRRDPQQAIYNAIEAESWAIQAQMCEGILASAPYHLGNYMAGNTGEVNQHGFSNVTTGSLQLLWPLIPAGQCTSRKPELRKWVISCLERIGYRMGIRQALTTATLLREGKSWQALH
jgi:hypothetical protein